MSTTTPRLQLTKPLGSESMILGAAQLADAYNKIDAAIGVKKFATQGAATAVFSGDLIQETSTGQAKLWTGTAWANTYDNNNGKGLPQEIDYGGNAEIIFSGFPEQIIQTTILDVVAARKYLCNVNFSVSADNNASAPLQGYARLIFKYTTNFAIDPNIVIHDVAIYISGTNSTARSKSFKAMFEFFPNLTGQVKFGIFGQIITGNQDLNLNLIGSDPSIYLVDWGT